MCDPVHYECGSFVIQLTYLLGCLCSALLGQRLVDTAVQTSWLDRQLDDEQLDARLREQRWLQQNRRIGILVAAIAMLVLVAVAVAPNDVQLETTTEPSLDLATPDFAARASTAVSAQPTTPLSRALISSGSTSTGSISTGSTSTASTVSTSTPGSTTSVATASTASTAPATSTTTPVTSSSTSSTTATSSTTVTSSSTIESSTTVPSSTTLACSGVSWQLVMEDGFDGTTLDRGRWTGFDGPGNGGNGLRRTTANRVADGNLNITAKIEDGQLISGGVRHGHDQTYGRYEVRVRTDVDPSGTMSGLVLTSPQAGQDPAGGPNRMYSAVDDPAASADWHTIVLEWTPTSIKTSRDGTLLSTVTDVDLIPAVNHYLAIQFDALGTTIPNDLTMQIDYVKVHSYEGGC